MAAQEGIGDPELISHYPELVQEFYFCSYWHRQRGEGKRAQPQGRTDADGNRAPPFSSYKMGVAVMVVLVMMIIIIIVSPSACEALGP